MVITISDSKTKITIPVLPEKIACSSAAYFREYDILNKGPVKIPNGRELTSIGWESFFPGPKVKKVLTGSSITNPPAIFHSRIETWKNNGTKLKLNITGTPFNLSVYIEKYEASAEDAFGSIHYSIEFIEAVDVIVSFSKGKTANKTSTKQRTSTKSNKEIMTIKKGDTLWSIARKQLGSGTKWKQIYSLNKAALEAAAKKNGKKTSDNGHWIYPGTVLKIP